MLVSTLEDSNSTVRETAKTSVVTLFTGLGASDAAHVDLKCGIGCHSCSCESDVLCEGRLQQWQHHRCEGVVNEESSGSVEHNLIEFARSWESMKSEWDKDVAPEGRTEGGGVDEPCIHTHGGDTDPVGVKTVMYHEREVHHVLLIPCVAALEDAVEPVGKKR